MKGKIKSYRDNQNREQVNYNFIKCPICNNTLEDNVYIYFKHSKSHSFNSTLKALDYATERGNLPCVITNIYNCRKCNYEQKKREMYFNETGQYYVSDKKSL